MLKDKSLRCGIFDSSISRKNETRSPERTVQVYEMELYHTDSGVSYVDGTAYSIRRGMLLCTRPGQVRYSQLPIRSSYIWVQPEPALKHVLDSLPQCTYIRDPEQTEMLLRLFTKLQCAVAKSEPEMEKTVHSNGIFLETLYACMQLCRGADRRPLARKLVRDAYGYMDKYFCQPCTLQQMAQQLHVSANHLHTVFVRSEKITPYDYVLEKRIERAKTLILMGESSMAQIALETGFCSQSHFTTAFKKKTGQTPARYRKNLFDLT